MDFIKGLLSNKHIKSSLIAIAGVALTYTIEYLSNTNFGNLTPVVVGVASVFVNALQTELKKYQKTIEAE